MQAKKKASEEKTEHLNSMEDVKRTLPSYFDLTRSSIE
jgi:hypothetical protein